jgi:transposase-like protein
MQTRRMLAVDLTRKHWSEGTAARVLAAWRASGTSLGGFARANGLNAERLRMWRKRIEGGSKGTAPTVEPMAFIPAAVVGTARVAVRLPRGVEVEGDAAGLPAEWVAALARELGRS